MIFDQQLCFIDKGELTSFTTGTVGSALDLGAPGQTGKGRPAYVAIACEEDMSATGSPVISLALEFSADDSFSSPVAVPLSLPPLGKSDFAKGKVVGAPAPLYSLRWVRLKMTTSAALACAKITAGFVLDLQTNN